jgi:predicted short-subunit dehydrogenase-like oxidoreductase (DUF2520 family)
MIFIGAGPVGLTMARLFSNAGHKIVYFISRNEKRRQRAKKFSHALKTAHSFSEVTEDFDILFISTPDDTIGEIAERITPQIKGRVNFYAGHFSAIVPSSVLQPLKNKGGHIGSLHPLQTFTSPEETINTFAGTYICIEGDNEAVNLFSGLAAEIGGKPFSISTDKKPLYHAAAVIACNYLVTLINEAQRLLQEIGINQENAAKMLLPLIKATVKNIESVGIPKALTGPVARGDIATLLNHIENIKEKTPDFLELYGILGLKTIEISLAKGQIKDETARKMKQIFQLTEKKKSQNQHSPGK